MTVERASETSHQLIGLPTLMTLAFNGQDLTPVADGLMQRIKVDPNDVYALMDMAIIFIMRGETKLAMSMKALALQNRQIYQYPRPAMPIKIRALMIAGPGDLMANSPFEFLIDQQPVALDILYVTPAMGLPRQVPEHDVLIVAVGESDSNLALLADLEAALANWPRPIINRPGRIMQLSRDASCALLSRIPQIAMPVALRTHRSTLEVCCQPQQHARSLATQLNGIDYPIIIRPVDSHAGQGLCKISTLSDLTGYLVNAPENDFFVSPFIDYRSADGLFRKYRILLMSGKPYLCHLAISQRWMVHYLNADMLDNATHRAEEAQCMTDFDDTLARRHAKAFSAIYEQLGLDYVGLDCAETRDGRLLIFEADSNMVVHNMDPADKFPYKKVQMPKLFHAFTQMLAQRSGMNL